MRTLIVAATFIFFAVMPGAAMAFSDCTSPKAFTDAAIKDLMLDYSAILLAPGGAGAHWEDKACVYYDRGYLNQQLGHYDAALADYTSALIVMKDFPQALAARGDVYMDLNQPDKAAADYFRVEMFRMNASAQNSICWARVMRGRPLDRALSSCDEALAQEPKSPSSLQSRCMVNFRMGNYTAAIADCSAALDNVHNKESELAAETYYPRGVAKLKSGDAAGGNADIAAAKEIDPTIADAYAHYGVDP